MEKHLIALDLDGTLLNSNSEISNFTKSVLERLQSLGHFVCISTGRPYHSSIQYYKELNLDSPLITDNGGNIREPNNPNFKTFVDGIPLEAAHDLFNFTKDHLVSAFYSYDEYVYAYKYLDRLHKIFMGSEKAKLVHADFDKLSHTPTGMIYLVDVSFKEQFESYINTVLFDTCNYRVWGQDSKHVIYEIYKKGTSKLSGIKWCCDYYDINFKNTIAFGDGLNDIELIEGVALGVAMPNGVDEVKKVAKRIASFDNDHDGVAKFLIEYFNL
ncbi:Cof-type HAD-IIB family hydrolase [Acholeplasma hippikon]|uniref:Cof-like hydrolase n=1 Tax=Acholeplasma hippikon TaxID=264636 RepID=A0A449BJL3_9MOLU|nr:Cof-type HAD-IIB family hydrolase [Acholeplasma hippikon]VEU82656.1 Cof-like hydrolase [Acholeplasma hippikon]